MIRIILSERDFDYEIQALVNSFFPGQKSSIRIGDCTEEDFAAGVTVAVKMEQTQIHVWSGCLGDVRKCDAQVSGAEDYHKRPGKLAHPYRTEYKNRLKSLIFQALQQLGQEPLPEGVEMSVPCWGTMTGVRPTKIPMKKILAGENPDDVQRHMIEEYHCRPDRAALGVQIAAREAALLAGGDWENGYSLYIGIPFCPTTCLYCSFPSYPMERFRKVVPEYIKALKREISYFGERLQGRRLSSIYIGGGTPTALSAGELQEVLDAVRMHFPVEDVREFTVEAGRPDSITEEKLRVIRSAGVERISVNPQTMQDQTLQLVGRSHDAAQVRESFGLARECGFTNINMDLIIGLPGETAVEFHDTLEQIRLLNPDSITIHSLVVKRASRLRECLDAGEMTEKTRAAVMEQMLEAAQNFAAEYGYEPYYMYRQKNSAGYAGSTGQENIGFARRGKECLYNILMMEEMQSILALGAGASTKIYDRGTKQVRRVENVKSIKDYTERVDEMLQKKMI